MARIKYQEAAGLEVKRGRPSIGPAPSKADLVKLPLRKQDLFGTSPPHWVVLRIRSTEDLIDME
jgi:hypothetical protein